MVLLAACGGDPAGLSGGMPAGGHVHALRAIGDGELLLGLHGALYRSGDQGATWEQAGLAGQDAMAIAAAGGDAPLFVAGHGLLARSDDGGHSFQPLRPAELGSLDVHALDQSASEPDRVYAFVVGEGLYASADAGQTWQLRAPSGRFFGDDVAALAVAAADPEVVLVGGGETGLVRSTDGGRTFRRVLTSAVASLATAAEHPQRVLALTARGLEVSADTGQRWTTVGRPDVPGRPVAVAADEAAVWLVTEEPRALQRSDDGGATWTEVARAEG
ncbi:MAG TPA: hypothetical protein VG452_12265 [Egibacteraceae bacterium]|nr:hypothetical protein [Egibacteraceae bacterium]